jgi:hypothetical protein
MIYFKLPFVRLLCFYRLTADIVSTENQGVNPCSLYQ